MQRQTQKNHTLANTDWYKTAQWYLPNRSPIPYKRSADNFEVGLVKFWTETMKAAERAHYLFEQLECNFILAA